MDMMYLFYVFLGVLVFWGAKLCPRGVWNEEYTSLRQMKYLQGAMVFFISLHHMAQKTCAPWHETRYIVHGLDFFVPIGFLFCAVFLFCSSYGLYKSLKTKPDYLKHFIRRRMVPIVVAYYLSEFIYTAIRWKIGEPMTKKTLLWYASGLHMANFNTWYIIAILLFYFIFYLAFRFCKKDGAAIALVFVAAIAYTVGGTFVDHQNDWFMRGEWWYNSIILFPIGLLFAKYEAKITAFFRKGYWLWLVLSFAGIFGAYQLSQYVNNNVCGYYGEYWNDPLKIWHRLGSTAGEWLVCIVFVLFIFLFLMKVKIGNKALGILGAVTLEYYLMHGVFVELFGYNFQDVAKSITYIKNVPLYIVVVLACSIVATCIFRFVWKTVMKAPIFK